MKTLPYPTENFFHSDPNYIIRKSKLLYLFFIENLVGVHGTKNISSVDYTVDLVLWRIMYIQVNLNQENFLELTNIMNFYPLFKFEWQTHILQTIN